MLEEDQHALSLKLENVTKMWTKALMSKVTYVCALLVAINVILCLFILNNYPNYCGMIKRVSLNEKASDKIVVLWDSIVAFWLLIMQFLNNRAYIKLFDDNRYNYSINETINKVKTRFVLSMFILLFIIYLCIIRVMTLASC